MAQRVYTKAEQKRLERFSQQEKQFLQQGYQRVDLTASLFKGNVLGLVYGLIFSIPFIVLFVYVKHVNQIEANIDDHFFRNYLIFLVLMLVLIVVHEGIHGVTWGMLSGAGMENIEFGFITKTMNPYCTCSVPLSKKNYLLGGLMPFFILGVLPCLISLFNHSYWWLAMGVIMIFGAGGDLLLSHMIIKHSTHNKEIVFMDHPTDIGCIAFEKEI